MDSTDGSRDDEAREEGSADESVLPPGPRRSTYTPPAAAASSVPGVEPTPPDAADDAPSASSPEAFVTPPPAPRDDLPAFIPPPPPAPDFEFLKPETAPVNVIYQLDDIEPNMPFDVAVEALAQSPAGARILPKEPVAEPATAQPIAAEPTVAEPFVVEPVVAEPAVVEPIVAQEVQADAEPEPVVDTSSPEPFDLPDRDGDVTEPVELADADADIAGNVDLETEPTATEVPIDEPADADLDGVALPEFDAWEASAPVGPSASAEPEEGERLNQDGQADGGAEPDSAAHLDEPHDPDDTASHDDAPQFGEPQFGEPQFDEPPFSDTPSFAETPVFDDESPTDSAVRTDDAWPFDDSVSFDGAVPIDTATTNGDDDATLGSDDELPAPAEEEAAASQPVVEPDWPFDQPRATFVPPAPAAEWFAESAPESVPGEIVDDQAVAEAPIDADGTRETDAPKSVEPGVVESEVVEPEAVEPEAVEPEAVEPTFADPRFMQPAAVEPQVPSEPQIFSPEVVEAEVVEADVVEADVIEADVAEAEVVEAEVIDTEAEDAPVALTEAEQLAALSQQGAPAGRPWIPERRSLKDEELASLLTGAIDLPNGTLGVMEELERQLQLREEETREFTEWQESMLAVGTPEAIAAVEKVLPEFTDIVPPGTSLAVAAAASAAPVAPAPPVPTPPAEAPHLSAPPPPFGAVAASVPPPPMPAPASPTAPSVVEDVSGAPFFEDAAADQRDVLDTAPPPLVEPPAPAVPESWSFDLDADTIVPEPVDGSLDPDANVVDEAVLADEEPEVVEPATAEPTTAEPQSKYAPSVIADAPIFINPIPVSPPSGADDASVVSDGAESAPALVEPGAFGGAFVDPVYTGPLTGSVSITTGGLAIAPEDLDTDIDDPLDEIDQAGFDAVFGSNPATAPVLVTRVPDDEVVLGEPELRRPRIFSLEAAGLEPTPEEQRVGRAARMFWLWFAANASIASLAFGGVLFSLGLSLRQAIVAVLAGVAVSFLPLGLGTLAGKRSGQPTMVVSRAAFGLSGNVLPASIAVISRVFWGSALLWILGQGVASVLDGAGLAGSLPRDLIAYLVMAAGLVVAIAFAVFGYGLIVLLQLVASIVSAILIVGVMVLTWQYVDVGVALTHPDGPWMLAGTAAVLVFSFIGLLWANSSGDLARYQRPGSSTPGSMLSSAFGATIPTFVLISYGALLAASNAEIAAGLVADPFDTIGQLLPLWYPAPLIVAIVLGLLSAVVISLYSGGFALTAVGVRVSRLMSVVVLGALIAIGAVTLMLIGTDYTVLFRDLATTLAVPVAAWAGIFAADAMIRQRSYDTEALLSRGGVYPAVNWVNLSALIVIIAVGFGLTTASAAGLTWQGYLFPLLGQPVDGAVAGTDLGVIVALVLGLLVPIVAGIPTIRKQEATARRSG